MGDIIKTYQVRSTAGERSQRVRLYFDTGSAWTFVKDSTASHMRAIAKLPSPQVFHGLGNGAFQATHTLQLQVRMLGMWVPHLCYVVPDEVIEEHYDVLLGHDFMQRYDVHLETRRRRVIVDKGRLRMALCVKRPVGE